MYVVIRTTSTKNYSNGCLVTRLFKVHRKKKIKGLTAWNCSNNSCRSSIAVAMLFEYIILSSFLSLLSLCGPFYVSSLLSSSCCLVYKVHTIGERICITRVGNFHPVHADSYKNGYLRRSRTSRTRFWLRRGYEAARYRENASHFYGVATNTEAPTTKRSARQLAERLRK